MQSYEFCHSIAKKKNCKLRLLFRDDEAIMATSECNMQKETHLQVLIVLRIQQWKQQQWIY